MNKNLNNCESSYSSARNVIKTFNTNLDSDSLDHIFLLLLEVHTAKKNEIELQLFVTKILDIIKNDFECTIIFMTHINNFGYYISSKYCFANL